MTTVQHSKQHEQYQISLAKRVLVCIVVELFWLIGLILIAFSTAMLCAVTLLNAMYISFIPGNFSKFANVPADDWYWITSYSRVQALFAFPIPNFIIFPGMFAIGTYLYSAYCPWPKTILFICVVILVVMFSLGVKFLGIPLI